MSARKSTTTTTTDATADAQPIRTGFKLLSGQDKNGYEVSKAADLVKLLSPHDYSEWTLGVWRKVETLRSKGGRSVETCEHGFHMSPTPYQCTRNVSGNVIALVEARGQQDMHYDESKSANEEMRIVAWWLTSDVPSGTFGSRTFRKDYAPIPADVQATYDAAIQAAYDAQYAADDAARTVKAETVQPAKVAYDAASQPHVNARELAKQLARIQYEAATQAARAVYDAASKQADADFSVRTLDALTAYEAVKHEASVEYSRVTMHAADARATAEAEALKPITAIREAFTGNLTDEIAKTFGTPAGLAEGMTLPS